jgi:hypothetical protein
LTDLSPIVEEKQAPPLTGAGSQNFWAKVIEVEQAQESWAAKVRGSSRAVLTAAFVQVERRYEGLKIRYGSSYTKAMLSAVFFALFLPVPGSSVIVVSIIVVIAEVHRAISKRDCFPGAIAIGSKITPKSELRELIMSINCDVILQWNATPEQLKSLGAALWSWCNRAAGNTGVYQYLDHQALADLIDGKHPISRQTQRQAERRGAHFTIWDEISHNRRATIESLQQEIPAKGLEDILVDGKSWNLID